MERERGRKMRDKGTRKAQKAEGGKEGKKVECGYHRNIQWMEFVLECEKVLETIYTMMCLYLTLRRCTLNNG